MYQFISVCYIHFIENSIWKDVADSPSVEMDYHQVEELFCDKNVTKKNFNSKQSAIKQTDTVSLLNGKRSLALNIFLKQFKVSYDTLVEMIKQGDITLLTPETIQGLLKILPEDYEVKPKNNIKTITNKFHHNYVHLCLFVP